MTIEHSEKRHKIFPGSNPAALREINRLNKQFWSKQSKLTVQRISDPTFYALATRDMYLEAIRVAFREQKSLDQALSDAEQALNVLWENFVPAERARRRSLGRKGGRSRKTNALQVLIETCVRKTPDISQRELWHQLKQYLGLGVITTIDDQQIEFLDHNRK